MGKVAPTDASLIKTTTQGRVQSALAPFIEFLAGQGYRPKWRWESTGDRYDRYPDREESITVGRIELASGPISSVELSSTTEATGEETPHEQPSYAVEWNTTNQVSYYLEPSWAQSGVPGLQLLTIYKSGNTWTGNDMGLGIIDRINSDESLRTLPTSVAIAAVEPETPPRPVVDEDDEIVEDPHAVLGLGLAVYLSSSTGTYRRRGHAPTLIWPVLQEKSWNPLITMSDQLLADSEYLPRRSPPTALRPVPAPRINYLSWALFQMFSLAMLVAGLILLAASISWIPGKLPWDPNGWWILGGIVITLVGGVLTSVGLNWLSEILGGCVELVGVLDRKWIAYQNLLDPSSGWPCIRVEGLPFLDCPGAFESFSEKDRITMLFWPGSKKIERIERYDPSNSRNQRSSS